jgi:hypothetical protein
LTPNYNSQPASMLEIIAQLARDPNADIAKFSALLDLKERMDAKDAETAFNEAMARLQERLPKINKDGKIEMGSKGSMKFATFEHILESIGPILRQEGFGVSFGSEEAESGVLVSCQLSHRQGHSRWSRMRLPADSGAGRNGLQALGSSLSYARRYLLTGMLNLVITGQDNDGSTAFPITDDQEMKLNDLMDGFEPGDIASFKKYMKVAKLSEIQRDQFTAAVSALQAKRRQKGLS